MESDRPNPLHIISTQLITLLITFLCNNSFVTHSVDFRTAVTHCHDGPWSAPRHRNNTSLDGPGLHHFIDSRQVIVYCLDALGRHHFIGTVQVLARKPPSRLESSRLLDLNHLTLSFFFFSTAWMCTFHGQVSTSPCLSPLAAAQDTPSQQPNSFPSSSSVSISCRSSTPSFRCQQRLTRSKRVSSPTSSRPWLVVTTAFHFNVTTFSSTQPLCHATARNRVTVEYKCFRCLSTFVTDVFHQQASCCSRSLVTTKP